MKKTVIIATIILLVVNLLAGLMLSGFKPFNVAFTSVVIVLTGALVYLLRSIPMKDAFVFSLSFLFVFIGLIEYVLGVCAPERFKDNVFALATVCLLAIEGIIITICSIVSKTPNNHE